jgi:twitching motility protein PilT
VSLVSSLLTAIVRADGDVLVLHVGERPYVVGPVGRSELASRALTLDAMKGMLAEILPAEARRLLEELGAVQHDLPASMLPTGQRFTVVAARGGDDIWVEIKRHGLSRVSDQTTQARAEAPRRTVEVIEQSEPAAENAQRQAVVLPLARNQVRAEAPPRVTQTLQSAGIDRLLRIAAARGASTLYLTSQARPSIRVDGEISAIEGESILGEADVESLILDILPERNREALRSQAGTEWICDVPDVGRIRCVTFRDHRGAGGIFRMIPARAISAEQLGLSREIQGLCAEAEGLVLVAGPRSSGKSTLISAFVDLINRTRSDHVITIENQIKFVHENRGSLVSQREVRGDRSELLSVARAALRENPDVLVFEDFGSPEIVALALEAAQSGHLVIAALTAHTATAAVDRLIDQAPPETRPKVQLALAENLRGIVVQVLLRKSGGGRVAAREVLLNTSAVANLIAEGKTSQLPMAIDSGRKHGMVALNDALVAFVQSGAVDSREAYRQAADQQGFLAQLKRQGIDTSFVERLA